MKLTLNRKFKGQTYTIGDLSIDGKFFCNTIEDAVRELPATCPDTPRGRSCTCREKVYSKTAIPAGTYKVTLQYSPKYKKKNAISARCTSFPRHPDPFRQHRGRFRRLYHRGKEYGQGKSFGIPYYIPKTVCHARVRKGHNHSDYINRMAVNRLKPPRNLRIEFKPSPRQYELWKLLQPNYCPHCGGEIEQILIGYDQQGNPQYRPQCRHCKSQNLPQLILGGGAAGGGKSYIGSVWLVSSCIRFENIRAVVARKTLKSLKESTWNTIKSILKDWGLKEDTNYKINNLEGTLTFWNDSVIIMKEMADIPSDPNFERFGSSEYTIAMVDEVSEISERAVEVLFSRLRWRTHETFKTPRMLLTTNPTINWVRSRFVQDENGDKVICREGEAYIPFSVFDNPNIAFRQVYEAALNKIRDQATKERLLYGNWDFVEANDMAIYNSFDGSRHLVTGLKEKAYDPTKPLITVWDFNVAPQMSVLSAQIDYENRKVYILEEILGKPEEKENNTPALARKVRLKLYRDKHIGGVDVTGDPSGLQRSTTNEDGINNYTIITDTFGRGILRPKVKLLRKQPPQATRCEFVNEVFGGYEGWEIQIDIKCRKLTQDLIYQLRNEDGTKSKQKTTDPKTGVKYERYGHLSDCLDYLLCYYLRDSWYKFKSGGDGNGYVVSTSVIQEGFSY